MKEYRVTLKAKDKTLYIALVEANSTREAIKNAESWQRIESPVAEFLTVGEEK